MATCYADASYVASPPWLEGKKGGAKCAEITGVGKVRTLMATLHEWPERRNFQLKWFDFLSVW